jgi:hypothetical protein
MRHKSILTIVILSIFISFAHCNNQKQPPSEHFLGQTDNSGEVVFSSNRFGDIGVRVKDSDGNPVKDSKVTFYYTGKEYAENAEEYIMLSATDPKDSVPPAFDVIKPSSFGKAARISWLDLVLALPDVVNGDIAVTQDVVDFDPEKVILFPGISCQGKGNFEKYKNTFTAVKEVFVLVSPALENVEAAIATILSLHGLIIESFDNLNQALIDLGWTPLLNPNRVYYWYTIDLAFESTTLYIPMAIAIEVPDDGYEENDTWDMSFEISFNHYSDLVLLDDDWYKFYLTSPCTLGIEIAIYFSHTNGDLDLEFYTLGGVHHPSTENPMYSSYSTTNNETISETICLVKPPGLDFYIRVFGKDGAINENYDLYLSINPQ